MFNTQDTSIICIDIQEKLVKMLEQGDKIASNCEKLLKAANTLNISTIITEQYPKGLGSTIEPIKSITSFITVEKTTFSALKTEEFVKTFKNINKKNVIIFGIETHICVLQSVIDLLKENYNVFIISDCCASRNKDNHNTALNLAQQEGARIITLEIALFNFLKSSQHPNFKEIQSLIK